MSWVVCPRCHFSQMPGDRCRRCGAALPLPGVSEASSAPSAPTPLASSAFAPAPSSAPPAPAPVEPRRVSRPRWWAAAVAAAALIAALWLARRGGESQASPPPAARVPTVASIDLSGRWHASISKSLGGNPPRPVLKEISLDSDREGGIEAARLVLTDPGQGGAGAGYRTAPDGARRLSEAASVLASGSPGSGVALSFDFLELPGWIPVRPRLWKPIEGAGRGSEPARYLLVESLETDYLIQAGINESGFLSYVFFSPAYAPARGTDQLSRVIHPEPGASLRGFRDLIWDLSGAADFLKLELPVTVSGPEAGAPDSVVLLR